MERRVNDETLQLIRQWEGLRLKAYQDVGGIWTIGYGHTLTAREGQVINGMQAETLLRQDLSIAEAAVSRMVAVVLTDNQFGALVSWVYNVGIGAATGSTLVRKLNTGDYAAVPSELMRWNKVGKREVTGLTNRRAAEAGLWVRGGHVAGSAPITDAPIEPVAAAKAAGITGAATTAASVAGAVLAPLAGLPWQVAVALIAAVALGAVVWVLHRERRA